MWTAIKSVKTGKFKVAMQYSEVYGMYMIVLYEKTGENEYRERSYYGCYKTRQSAQRKLNALKKIYSSVS